MNLISDAKYMNVILATKFAITTKYAYTMSSNVPKPIDAVIESNCLQTGFISISPAEFYTSKSVLPP